MITHQRAEYLRKALASLLQHRRPGSHPIIASQDGDDGPVRALLQQHEAAGDLQVLRFAPQKRLGQVKRHQKGIKRAPLVPRFLPTGYQRLCAHYAWALTQVFGKGYDGGHHPRRGSRGL